VQMRSKSSLRRFRQGDVQPNDPRLGVDVRADKRKNCNETHEGSLLESSYVHQWSPCRTTTARDLERKE
jgi:hypothetical protein